MLQFRSNANWSHCQNGYHPAVIGFNNGFHKYILTDQSAVLFHNKIQLFDKRRIVTQYMDHIMLTAPGTIDVPEGFPDKFLHFPIIFCFFRANDIVFHVNSFSFQLIIAENNESNEMLISIPPRISVNQCTPAISLPTTVTAIITQQSAASTL